jgi:hypothetical protein
VVLLSQSTFTRPLDMIRGLLSRFALVFEVCMRLATPFISPISVEFGRDK